MKKKNMKDKIISEINKQLDDNEQIIYDEELQEKDKITKEINEQLDNNELANCEDIIVLNEKEKSSIKNSAKNSINEIDYSLLNDKINEYSNIFVINSTKIDKKHIDFVFKMFSDKVKVSDNTIKINNVLKKLSKLDKENYIVIEKNELEVFKEALSNIEVNYCTEEFDALQAFYHLYDPFK